MERKIGEIFEYNGEWYQCIRSIACTYCGFNKKGCLADKHITGDCSGRLDGASVIFRKLEKVGEPYEKRVSDGMFSTFQRYRVYNPATLPKELYIYYNSIDNTIEIEIKENKENMKEYKMYDAKKDIPKFDKIANECLFGGNKLNLKPFDLKAAKAGKPVCTRDGRKARIICFDRSGTDYPILSLIKENDKESVYHYDIEGKSSIHPKLDLMMLLEKKEKWINIYKKWLYDSKEDAMEGVTDTSDYICTVKVELEE